MANNNQNGNKGMGFTSALTIAFIILKLTKVIDWAWLWVLSPMWITAIAILIVIIIYIITSAMK